MSALYVSVPHPDDSHAPPIYEGSMRGARRLVPDDYSAYTEDVRAVVLRVPVLGRPYILTVVGVR